MKICVCGICNAVIFFVSVLLLSSCSTMEYASTKPNIILISTDDLSYMDVQEYAYHVNGEKKRRMFNETPNLNRLCRESICFEQAYASRLYSHEYDGLLTGRINAERKAVKSGSMDLKKPDFSIARVLPGYHSAFIGKWHSKGSPEKMGFYQLGLKDTSRDYSADFLTDKALQFIEHQSGIRSKPFFLYLSYSVDHGMRTAKAKDVKHFSGKLTRGRRDQNDPQYAAMVKGLDDSVGRILHKLWRNGLDENTVVIFISGRADAKAQGGIKNTLASKDMRVPLMIRWKGHVKAGSWCNVPVDYADILPTVIQCAGFFPESISDDVQLDGCSLTGLFWDAKNKSRSYERNVACIK